MLKHGMRNTPEYEAWRAIKKRCYNKDHEHYDSYGGRGILMCDEWKGSFEAFYRDMGQRPSPEHSLDREDNDKGYDKDNCRWATWEEQNNNRRNNTKYTHDGKTLTLPEWSRELGIELHTLKNRIWQGWSFEETIGATERIGDQMAFEFSGQTRTLKAWCRSFNVPYETVRKRLKRGISFEESVRLSIADKFIVFDGAEKALRFWCDLLCLDLINVSKRIMHGETFEAIAFE